MYGGTPQHLYLNGWGKWRILGTKHKIIKLTFTLSRPESEAATQGGGVRVLELCLLDHFGSKLYYNSGY